MFSSVRGGKTKKKNTSKNILNSSMSVSCCTAMFREVVNFAVGVSGLGKVGSTCFTSV